MTVKKKKTAKKKAAAKKAAPKKKKVKVAKKPAPKKMRTVRDDMARRESAPRGPASELQAEADGLVVGGEGY